MSLAFPNDSELVKQALVDELQKLLSCEKEQMDSAEERVKQLECTEGYGVYLAEIVMNQSFELPLRQMACIMLTRYVEKNWHEYDEDGHRNDERGIVLASESAKRAIRNILPNGLYDPNSKIRSSVAHTISTIASLDDPVAWTDLFDIVIKYLSGNEDSIHGASLVLTNFNYDVKLIHSKGPLVVKEAFRVFITKQYYTIQTRVGALRILGTLLKSISALITDTENQEEMVNLILTSFMPDFMTFLKIDNTESSNLLMRAEIAKLLTFVATEMPEHLYHFMPTIMPVIWQLLTHAADIYVKLTVNNTMENPFALGDDDDSSEYLQFHNMITQVLEFINSIVTSQYMREFIEPVLEDLIYITIVFMELTVEQLNIWKTDPSKFVEDEDETGFELTVRMCGKDLLLVLADEYNVEVLKKLQGALLSHFAVAKQELGNGNENWWKIQEASMMAVHIFRDIILENPEQFDLVNYLMIVHSSLSHVEAPHLVGRALWTLGAFSKSELYNEEMLTGILDVTLENLSEKKELVTRISAVRAIHGFLQAHESSESIKRKLILRKMPEFFKGIQSLLTENIEGSALLVLMEAITAIASFDADFARENVMHLIRNIFDPFQSKCDDPFVLESAMELLSAVCKQPSCLPVVTDFLLMRICTNMRKDIKRSAEGLPGTDSDLEFLTILVKHQRPPLPKEMLDEAFPLLIELMTKNDDPAYLVAGGECLRTLIHVAPREIPSASEGKILRSIMDVTIMLLNPMQNEMNAGQVGRLIITIITKLSTSLKPSDMDLLLKAVLSKMQLVGSLKVIMSLILIFAHLFLTSMEAAIDFLTTIPDPTGATALNYVLTIWVSKQASFFGTYERRVTTMALCKILEHAITTNDTRLVQLVSRELIDVPNDEVASEGVRRRSQVTKQWTDVPILVKIFKALIDEMFFLREAKIANYGPDEEDNKDDDPGAPAKPRYISDLYFSDEEANAEDDDMLKELLADPDYKDMEDFVSLFLAKFAGHHLFSHFYSYLSAAERDSWNSMILPLPTENEI